MPPAMNTDFQPKIGISRFATGPPRAVPSEYPIMITVTMVARYRLGAYSILKAPRPGGSIPPSGMPSIGSAV